MSEAAQTAPTKPAVQTEIEQKLLDLGESFRQAFAACENEQALRDENAKVLGKKGFLTAILKEMGKVPNEARKQIGEKVNGLKQEVESAFEAKLVQIRAALREQDLKGTPFDLTLPGRIPTGTGHKHPVNQVREEVIAIFRSLGFGVHDGREVELDENNFGKLGFPPDHPAQPKAAHGLHRARCCFSAR
jgi:phenylalanyl-tRNA synthetase alpha chain